MRCFSDSNIVRNGVFVRNFSPYRFCRKELTKTSLDDRKPLDEVAEVLSLVLDSFWGKYSGRSRRLKTVLGVSTKGSASDLRYLKISSSISILIIARPPLYFYHMVKL